MTRLSITVVGGGIVGLWQAFELSRRGHRVTLREAMPEPETGAASRCAGAMLAPYCEAEAAPPLVRELGLRGLASWRATYPAVVQRGSLVVAATRDQGELSRFARMTSGHQAIASDRIAELEPTLAPRFSRALFFPEEAHISPRAAMVFLIGEARRHGAELRFGDGVSVPIWQAAAAGELVVDCRGIAARDGVADLRGVRGEMVVVRAADVELSRPVRLLHPRFPIYVVPWGDGLFMIGATMIEREDFGPVTVRSALELLGAAYTLSPAFGEAEIVELRSGVRPAFPDNLPRIMAHGRSLQVNGVYRHGFLLGPVLAEAVANHVETGETGVPGLAIETAPATA